MVLNRKLVIEDFQIASEFSNQRIIVYGTGKDGMDFYKQYKEKIEIDFFIDKSGQAQSNIGKKVYKLKDGLSIRKNQKIIICSRKNSMEMATLLEENGLIAGRDFLIWDMGYGDALKRMINHNKDIWSDTKVIKKGNIVIFPLENCHDGTAVLYSYFANYFAQKYNAQIFTFIRQGGTPFESIIYPSDFDLYRSFNMEKIIEVSLSDSQIEKVNEIYDNIIQNIHTTDDWETVSIDGIQWGLSIIRDYLRLSSLSFESLNNEYCLCLKNAIKKIIFWTTFIEKESVKCVVLWDGVHNESYLRDIAIRHNIPIYIIHSMGVHKPELNFHFGSSFPYLKEFYNQLTLEEKKIGLKWSKQLITQILEGKKGGYNPYRTEGYVSVFQYKKTKLDYVNNGKISVLICPHIFDEDQWNNGLQICGNNFISWLSFLGEISEKTDYNWFIKMHPDEGKRGNNFLLEYVKKYPKIKLLPADISPVELKEMGIRYALTIAGSIGHEYPLLGIDVINAGNNPHIAFNFNINPGNLEEYEKVIYDISNISKLEYTNEIYEFFTIYYLYYKNNNFVNELKDIFKLEKWIFSEKVGNGEPISNIYGEFLNIYSDQLHEEIKRLIPILLEQIDSYSFTAFHKKTDKEVKALLETIKE